MNRRNRNKSRSERGKPTFKATAKAKAFSPRKTRLSKNDKKKLVETVKAEVAESSKSKPKEKKKGSATTQNTMNLRLTEHGAGITEYISKHEGFSAIIKQRYSDFHVNEIDCDGNVVTLTTLEAPEAPVAAAETKEGADDYLKATLTEEQYKKLMELVDSNGEEVEIEATDMNKEDRRKLHTAIIQCGKSRLISNTVEKDGKKFIIVRRSSKAGKQERRAAPWPAHRGGEYVYFILHKENMDTVETVNLIASRLRVKPNMITYAGMKDRRAKTSQLMCVWKVEPQRLVNVSRSLRGIELGNYSFHQRPLRLGDLRGNRFRIVLRNVTGSDKQIEDGLTSLKTKGFLNYYGLQRFGSSLAVPTHEIGKALLQGNWQKAVELILKPRDGEPLRFLAEARKVWWETRDPTKAIKILRNKDKMIEGKLLLGLSRHGPKNYLNALDNIPRNTRLMYLHSYQSLIWNKVVSRRMQKFGLQPIAGDLVLQGEERGEPVELLEVGDHDTTATQQTSDTADDNVSNKQKPSVRILSESDLKDFTIYDVVLPLPGHDIVYPQNETKEWFEELLQADGLSPAKLKQSVRAYSVGGAYRRIAVRPTNVSWKIMHYSDPQTTLVLSDLEEMQKVAPPEDEKGGVYKALILDFCLPSSTYATMAVREVLKSDTSCYNQALLNDYHVPTGPNGTPKRRLSSAENGDSVSSSRSEDVKMEPQDQVTSTKNQGSSICTRATKREKKTAESDGQMEIESMPGGRTPETSASKTEDKDEPSSETAAVLSVSSFPLLKEMVPMDIDKNEQQLITQNKCCVAPKPALTEKSVAAMEVEAIKVEVAVKCEPNAIKAIPQAPFAVSAPQEQLPSATGGVRNLQASVETEPGLAREFGDVAGKEGIPSKLEELSSLSVQKSTVLPIRKTSAISDTSSESTVRSQTDHIKDGSSAELIPDPIVPLSAESVLPSEELAENADVLPNQHLSRRPETAAALKSQMTERTALNDTATVSKTIISTEDTVLDKHNVTTVSTLTDNATFMDKGTLPKDTIAVSSPSDDVEMPNGKVEISSREEKGKPISDIEEPPNDSPCQIQDTLHHETVTSSDRVCLHTDESKQQSFTDRMVSELSTQSENSLSFPSEDTKNSTGTKIQMQKLEMPEGTHIDKVSDASLGLETKKFDKMSSGVDRRITEVAKLSEQTTNEAVTAMIELKGSATLQTGDTLVAETTSVSDDEAESQSQKPKLCVKNENDQVTSESITETSSLETTESMKTLGRPLNKSAVVLSLSEAETSDADTKSKVDTSIVEIVSEKLESVVSRVNQGTSVPLAMTSEGTEQELKTTGLQISQETTEIHDVAGLDTTLPSVLSTSKSENEMVKLENEQKETEIPVSEAEALQQVGQYTETEELINVSADEYQLETSSPKAVIEQNKLSGAEIPLGRTSLTADMQEIEAPHSPTVTSEIDIAHTLDPLSAEQNCEGKRKLPKEISSEPVVKSKVIEQTSVLECKNPVKVVESVHAEISSNQEQGDNAQETLTAPELASSSVCGSSEIVKDSLPQIDSQCPLSEVVEAAFTSELETSARSTSVATTELLVKRGTDVMQMEKTDGIEQFLKDSNSHNVKVSCVGSEKSVISVESGLEKMGEALKSSEVATSSALSSKESLVKEKRDMSELSAKSSVNQGSKSISSISRPSSETNLFEKTVSKEIASDGVSISQSTVTAKDKDSLAHSTSVSVPEKNDSETAKTEVTDKILLQSCERPYISEQCYVEEKSKEENVELCEISKKFKGKELSLAKEDMAGSIKLIEQKSAKEDKVKDTSINVDCALLSTSLQPYANVCEGKVTENCESISGRAGSPCSQSSPSKQPKPDVKCVSSVADGSSSEKEDVEKNRTHSSTSDTSRNKNTDLQPHVKHNVKSGTGSERMEASIKRKVGEGETETEMSPKKVKVDNYNSGTPTSVSDAQCLRSPDSLKRKSANDDTETNDQERNTEKKKLKVETSE